MWIALNLGTKKYSTASGEYSPQTELPEPGVLGLLGIGLLGTVLGRRRMVVRTTKRRVNHEEWAHLSVADCDYRCGFLFDGVRHDCGNPELINR
jgi:hypothetical protein